VNCGTHIPLTPSGVSPQLKHLPSVIHAATGHSVEAVGFERTSLHPLPLSPVSRSNQEAVRRPGTFTDRVTNGASMT
jgi:hypothetical protein